MSPLSLLGHIYDDAVAFGLRIADHSDLFRLDRGFEELSHEDRHDSPVFLLREYSSEPIAHMPVGVEPRILWRCDRCD